MPTPAAFAPIAPAPQRITSIATPSPFQIFAAELEARDEQLDDSPFEEESTQSTQSEQPTAQINSRPQLNAEPVQPVAVTQAVAPSLVIESLIAGPASAPAPAHFDEAAPTVKPSSAATETTQLPTPVAEVVIDKPLAPWETKVAAGTTQPATASPNALPVSPASTVALNQAVPPSHGTPQSQAASVNESTPSDEAETVDAPAFIDVSEPESTFASSTSTNANTIASAVTPQSVASHASSNVVRFPGLAAQAAQSAPPFRADETETIHAHDSASADAPAIEPSPDWIASTVPATTPPAELPAAPPAETVVQRPPLRGHAPANGFEFHAPAASMVELPTLDLLAPADTDIEPVSEEKLIETGLLIEQRLQEFKVPVTVVGASAGPVITRFEVEPALGVRGSQIVGLMKDLSRGLGLTSIRVVETIPGKTCMGLELPNAKRQTIRLSEILEASVYQNSHSQLTLAMGKDITGHPVVADLAKAPHMLVAGTTGSGKSVAINAMICSLLYKATPEEVRLIMIDPKMLELSVYEGIPHLLAPVVTDMKLAANALNWCVGEMEKRYRLMSAVGVRNLAGFNQKIRDTEAKGKKLGNPFSLTPEAPEPLAPLPLIVVVIDELADLMMVAGKKIEELIARLAQKARAAGIHLILATQRPSVDVITGLIKANIPTRVAFQVSSKIDSRTILDQMGAESLLGQGDMLFLPPGTGYPQRVHGAFVADEEVHRIVEYLKQFGEPQYEEGILDGPATDGGAAQDLFGESPDAEADPLYDEAVAFVVRTRRASISSVQRQLRIGYNRAARLVEQMETAGLVSAMSISGSREVLAPGPAE